MGQAVIVSGKTILIGGGEFGRELLSWAQTALGKGGGEIVGYADDAGATMDGYSGISIPHLGGLDALDNSSGFLLAIAAPQTKKRVVQQLRERGARFTSVIHPSAVVTDSAALGEGVVVGPHCYVANHAVIGDLVSINSFTGVGHDVRLGAFSTVSSGVDLMGGVHIGEQVFLGSGARILPGVKVAEGARIGAGSIVVRDVKPGQTLYAAPAKLL